MYEFLYTAQEVAEMLAISRRTAHKRIQAWNVALKDKGYHIEPGKIPKSYFHEINPYIKKSNRLVGC